jgi:hypothetical protein
MLNQSDEGMKKGLTLVGEFIWYYSEWKQAALRDFFS